MYLSIGKPKKLSNLNGRAPTGDFLKKEYEIAVIDDNPFPKLEALHAHGFRLSELGDIKRIEQVAEYPIVICDIRGVGGSFESVLEGAHLLAEIRKRYPDKFLVAYSGAESNMGSTPI